MRKKFDFLILVDNFYETRETDSRVYRTANHLKSKGYDVCICCFSSPAYKPEELIDNIPVFRIIPIEVTRMKSLFSLRSKIARIIEKKIHTRFLWGNDHLMLNIACRIRKRNPEITLIYDSHEYFQDYHLVFFNNESNWIKWKSRVWRKIEQYLERRDIQAADYVVASNASIAAMMNAVLQTKRRVGVLRNIPVFDTTIPLSLKDFSPTDYAKLETIKGKKNLIYFGNYTGEINGLEVILRALTREKDINLILCGNNKSKIHFDQLIKALDIQDQLVAMKPVPPFLMPEVGSYAMISVVPTRDCDRLQNYYSLSNKLMESVLIGIPIVCTSLPEHKTILGVTQSGLAIDPYDEEIALEQFLDAVSRIFSGYESYRVRALQAKNMFDFTMEFENWFSSLKVT